MPWFRFRCQCGPGHQSHDEKTVWFEGEPTKETLKEYWSEAFSDRDDPCSPEGCWGGAAMNGKAIERLSALPASRHQYMTRDYEDQQKNAAYMLEIMKKTPTEQEYVVQWLLNGKWVDRMSPMSKKMAMAWLRMYKKHRSRGFRVVPYNPRREDDDDYA